MRRMAKFIMAAILCAAMVSASTAWARDRYYRSAHPKGDETTPMLADGGSGSIVTVLLTSTPLGFKIPTIIIVTTAETKTTSRSTTVPVVKLHRVPNRKGATR